MPEGAGIISQEYLIGERPEGVREQGRNVPNSRQE